MNSTIPDTSTVSDTNAEIAALKNQVFTLLVALIVVSGTLTVYLYRQVSLSNKEIAQYQRDEYNIKLTGTNIMTFVNRLVMYGEKHPDFATQVLKKYNIAPVPGVPAVVPGAPGK